MLRKLSTWRTQRNCCCELLNLFVHGEFISVFNAICIDTCLMLNLGKGNKNFEQHFQKIIFGLWHTLYTYLWSVFNMSLISPDTGGKSNQLYWYLRKLSLKHFAHGLDQVKYNPSDIALLSKFVQYLDNIGGLLQWLHKTVDKSRSGFTYVSSYYIYLLKRVSLGS